MPKGIYDRSNARENKGIFKKGRAKIAGISKGDKMSEESRLKMSRHWKEVFKDETKHPRWMDNKAGYGSKHNWIYKHYGKASKCENGHKADKYEWANITGSYLRNISDWMQLCVSCHRRFDVHSNKLKTYEKR